MAILFFFIFKILILFFSSLLALEDVKFTRIYLVLSAVGHVSLFPLLFTAAGELSTCM